MKTIFITGNHSRHIYLVKKFTKLFANFKWIMETRDININDRVLKKKSKLYKKHILDFKKKEKILFKGTSSFLKRKKKEIINIKRDEINSFQFNKEILKIIKKFKPKILFSYGCQKIDILKIRNKKIRCFNIHGGLLPKYRGVNTNFWPHKNSESNSIGLTLHELTDKIDSGDIYFQTTVSINKYDTINSLSCKAVMNFCNKVPKKIFYALKKDFQIKGIKFKTNSKTWMKKDFKPNDIKVAYRNFKNFLKNENIEKPPLININ